LKQYRAFYIHPADELNWSWSHNVSLNTWSGRQVYYIDFLTESVL